MGDRLRACIPSRYVTSQLGQLSLASLRGRLIEYQFRLRKGRENNTVWSHMACEFRSGVATLRTAIHLLLTYLQLWLLRRINWLIDAPHAHQRAWGASINSKFHNKKPPNYWAKIYINLSHWQLQTFFKTPHYFPCSLADGNKWTI